MSARRLLRIVVLVLVGLVAAVLLLLLFLQTRWGGEWLARVAARQVAGYVDGEVSIGRIQGSLFSTATLSDVVLSRDGEPVVAIERVSAGYDIAGILGGGDFVLDDLTIVRPEIYLTRGPEGLALAALFDGGGEPEAGAEGTTRRVSISPLVIRDGHVVIGPEPAKAGGFEVPDELRNLQARLTIRQGPDGVRVQVEHLSFVGSAPSITLEELSGEIVYENGDLVFDGVTVQTVDNQLTLNGAIRNVTALGGAS